MDGFKKQERKTVGHTRPIRMVKLEGVQKLAGNRTGIVAELSQGICTVPNYVLSVRNEEIGPAD
ncbi:uncharacterized protein Smp_202590 [Schistosoma mansoni]|uniref:uncharacterized protein n=1 Tax=Schistosoma mansoni TaxID=6183 RepID=UPI00022DC839|nr:uncharacterized protein Smp_202590 [Schistosoma mansoni]|eukprot:XP_018652266.1 uncharacterized protein Smp_202590 [Schistosoma mansoni]